MSIILNGCITFIDSYQFYNSSIDTLTSNLEDNDFKHLTSEFGIDKLEILKRKDAYPSEWVDSYEKLEIPKGKDAYPSEWVDSYEKFKHSSLPEKKYIHH